MVLYDRKLLAWTDQDLVDSFVDVQDFLCFAMVDLWIDSGFVDLTKVREEVELIILVSHREALKING